MSVMCNKQQCISILSKASPFIRKEFGVKSMHLFGSVARGENTEDSDVDLFVDMPPKALRVVALRYYLQDLLGTTVDLIRKHSRLDSFMIKEIERDGICIFE